MNDWLLLLLFTPQTWVYKPLHGLSSVRISSRLKHARYIVITHTLTNLFFLVLLFCPAVHPALLWFVYFWDELSNSGWKFTTFKLWLLVILGLFFSGSINWHFLPAEFHLTIIHSQDHLKIRLYFPTNNYILSK